MPTGRPTNAQLAAEFRELLTHGFYVAEGADREEVLRVTKDWRGELWRAFHNIQDRLEPLREVERNRQR